MLPIPDKPYLRPGEAAYYAGVCVQTIRNLVKANRLESSITDGGHLRIVTASLKNFLAKNAKNVQRTA